MTNNRLLPVLGVLALAVLACGSSAPRQPLDLYSTPNALPTQTERVVIWTQTPNALPTPIIIIWTQTPNATPTPNAQNVIAVQALNVRGYYNVAARTLVVLPAGAFVEVTGLCVDGWAPIQFTPVDGVGSGWVNAEFLTGDLCK